MGATTVPATSTINAPNGEGVTVSVCRRLPRQAVWLTCSSDLRTTNVELLSDMAADFSTDISNCTLGNIPVGGTCTILAYFTPHATGTRTGTLHLIDNEQTPATLLLTGESPL